MPMHLNRLKVFLLAVPMLFMTLSVSAQGWEKAYGSNHGDGLFDVINTPDNGYISVGHQQTSSSPAHYDLFVLKTDAGGFEDWSELYHDSTYSYYGRSILETMDGGYIVGGTAMTENIPRGFMAKIGQLGQLEWIQVSPQDSVTGQQAIELDDGTFMLVGSIELTSGQGQDHDFFQMTVSENGATILETLQYGGAGYDNCEAAVKTAEGDIVMAGFTNSQGNGHYDIYVIKIDPTGDTIWTKSFGSAHAELAYGIANTSDGNLILTGQAESPSLLSEDVFLFKVSSAGDSLWYLNYPKVGNDLARDVKLAPIGGFIITGYSQNDLNADRQAFLLKTYSNGEEHWKKHFGGVQHDGGQAVIGNAAFEYVMAGYTLSFGQGRADGYLVKTDLSGLSNACFIVGNVHSNDNNSCVPEEFGQYIPNMLVEVAGDISYFGTTNDDGDYTIPVQAGDYNVRLVNPSPLWNSCEDSVDVSLVNNFDTAIVNYSLYPDTSCAYMRVDMSTLSMRRCFQNVYNIHYCNLGTADANPAEVEVTFDEYLVIDSSSIPWVSQNGQTYTFNVGFLSPFECGSFNVFYTVDCDSTVLGQTHCSEVHIYPDVLCVEENSEWDESSIELAAVCEGDSIIFKIINIGSGDMEDPLEFIVIEDFIVGLQGDFLLDSGEDTTIVMPANGATWRLEAHQSKGHPGNSKPCVSVEGCGGINFNTGFVIQYPLNDADPFVDTDCRENTGSYDPNDKQGFPVGYGPEHFIEPNTDIEYLIRFQNTGTDTAITVVIRDTLSPFLDPTSIEVGGGSHSFRYELYGTGILKFTFDEIMLPDSNINEPASHGFVKFRIKQRENVPLGTTIYNSAAIYFDFNEPIITNTTDHEIGLNFIEVDIIGNNNNYGSDDLPWVHVYPNPFVEKATFELKNVPGNDYVFQLFNATGQLTSTSDFQTKFFQFERDRLPGGIYFFKILSKGKIVSSGKIVLR